MKSRKLKWLLDGVTKKLFRRWERKAQKSKDPPVIPELVMVPRIDDDEVDDIGQIRRGIADRIRAGKTTYELAIVGVSDREDDQIDQLEMLEEQLPSQIKVIDALYKRDGERYLLYVVLGWRKYKKKK